MVDVLPTIATDFCASAFLTSRQPVKKPTKEGAKNTASGTAGGNIPPLRRKLLIYIENKSGTFFASKDP